MILINLFDRRTALHVAAEAGNASVVSALIHTHANFDAQDCNGDNALHIAVKEGHIGVVRNVATILFRFF